MTDDRTGIGREPARCRDPIEHYKIDSEMFDYFESPHPLVAEIWERLRTAALRYLPGREGLEIVDVGSGGGWLAARLEKRRVTVTSVDLSHRNLVRIRDRYDSQGVVGSGTQLPIASGSVDAVIASEVIEHLNEPDEAIREFVRILKPGGRVIITTPYREKIKYHLCIHCNKPTPINAHLHSFDEKRLTASFSSAGCSVILYRRIGNKGMLYLRIYYLLRWLPFPVWSVIDRVVNAVVPKAAHIVVCGIK
jgi:SAM-dependent methyltransferase